MASTTDNGQLNSVFRGFTVKAKMRDILAERPKLYLEKDQNECINFIRRIEVSMANIN